MSSPTEHERGFRTVAGRKIRLVELEWHDGLTNPVAAESWDAYDDETGTCLTMDGSYDYEPDEGQLLNALWAVTWLVDVDIKSGVDNFRARVGTEALLIIASDEAEARDLAVKVVQADSPYFDARVDPRAEAVDAQTLEYRGEEDEFPEIKVGLLPEEHRI